MTKDKSSYIRISENINVDDTSSVISIVGNVTDGTSNTVSIMETMVDDRPSRTPAALAARFREH